MNLDNFICGGKDVRAMYASMPLRDYVEVWLNTFKSDTVKPATYMRLESTIKALKKYDIADMIINDITAFDIQRYVNQVADDGYGLTTVKKMLRIVTAPLRQAAALHFIPADPSAGVKLPTEDKIKKKKRAMRAYTEEEQEALWQQIESSTNPVCAIVGLMLETGLRCGEALALRWRCVDLNRNRLRVEATILNSTSKGRSVVQDSPKTLSSKRIVPLTPRAVRLLRNLPQDSEWVFTIDGHRIGYETLRYQTIKLCKAADVPYFGQHVFRHTFATNCYYRKVDIKILSKILGHSDVNITYNIYVNLRGDGFDEMYEALTKAV